MFLQRIGNRGLRLGTLFERAAARHPANLMVFDHDLDIAPEAGRRLTVAEVADLIADCSSRLRQAGIRSGARVVVHKSDGFDIMLLACAVNRIGAVPVLLSPALDGETAAELIRRADRPHLITDRAKLDGELPAEVFEFTRSVVLASGRHPDALALADLGGGPPAPAVVLPADLPMLITHTSGTTGTPKLAVHTARSMQARYRPQRTAIAPFVRGRETVAIHVSFVHSRLVTALAISLLKGYPVLVLRDGEPAPTAELFARLRPGILEAHPNSYMSWEELADDPRGPLANVKLFSSTFDAIHPRTVQRLLGASRRSRPLFGQIYGQSEVGPALLRAFSLKRAQDADGRCVGMPVPGMTEARVVSRGGRPPSAENPGFIEVRSDGRIVTYLGEQQRYAEQLTDGWWRMGDVGYRTRWGCIHLLDREVDVIPGFGSSLAAEDLLFTQLDQLAEVVIVPGAQGTPPVPVVCTKDGRPLDPAAWRAAAARLPAMAEPVHWRLEDLPQTATRKIKRLDLARLLSAAADHAE